MGAAALASSLSSVSKGIRYTVRSEKMCCGINSDIQVDREGNGGKIWTCKYAKDS